MQFNDITGQRFGRWTTISFIKFDPKRRTSIWLCRCDCGTEKPVMRLNLTRAVHGCNKCSKSALKHGHAKRNHRDPKIKRLYGVWVAMRQRCNNPNDGGYPYYGGRGIKVCKRWNQFENFLADMGLPPPNHSLDRKNNDKGYDKRNCRWATWEQQVSNRRAYGTGPNATRCSK